jgi:hypothetical protein
MHLPHYLGLLHRLQTALARGLRTVAKTHQDEVDVYYTCQRLAEQCDQHATLLRPMADRYAAEPATDPPAGLHPDRFTGPRNGPLGLLRDLQDLYVMTAECDICWTIIGQAAHGARDRELLGVVTRCEDDTATQLAWLRTRMNQAAPQTLIVAS